MKEFFTKYPIRILVYICAVHISLILISADKQTDISQYQQKIKDVALQIDKIKRILSQEEQRGISILAQLDLIGLKKELVRQEIVMFNTKLQQSDKEQKNTQKRISDLQEKLNKEKQSLSKIIVTLYKFGDVDFMDLLFQVKDIKGLIAENKNLAILAETQENILNTYLATLNELIDAKKELLLKKQEITQLLSKTRRKRQELASKERENRSLINRIKQDKQIHEQRLGELNLRQDELQNLLKKILTQESSLPFIPSPLYDKKGKLDWPIPGNIVSRFGKKRHPRFNTWTQNDGIKISPRTDVIVKAVHPASVSYSDYFRGYGNLIILDHGLKYYTFYGHCAEILVKTGDFVNAGQAIAYAGDIGSLEGKSLYFAIRSRDKFLNPLQWLKRR